ncbi:putative monooxygenase YxeK [Pseudomonas reidholzensis]|uniref:Putative monooxygenase YxeK n=1 Tax=Pseudomonas reidholzensis TaxID=1785162 RepID=A0A383RYE0_9PSED|nr:NtaA/DmoA family FMN-dependent monooxygenase [Pseudomonas reidholzensis]SYX91783.1 putative monooxygenase YxeK [Pseudomonas reidholzensis]
MGIAQRRDYMKLGYFHFNDGFHSAGWRINRARHASTLYEAHRHAAVTAERGGFDVFFLGDSLDTTIAESASRLARLDPIAVLSAASQVTRHIGLVATMSTTYSAPYLVARQIGSLDQLSGGRAGWNLVTSYSHGAAQNFNNQALPPPSERYERAEEFVDVVRGLWDSFDEDAYLVDKVSGRFVDPAKVHALDHTGKHYSVRGPIPVPRSPQGQPVLVQAGASTAGVQLGARIGELIFARQPSLCAAVDFRRAFHQAMGQFHRQPGDAIVMPGVIPVIGSDEEEAKRLRVEMDEAIDVEHGLYVLQDQLGTDLSSLPLDAELPRITCSKAQQGVLQILDRLRAQGTLTVEAAARYMGGMRGHIELVGSPEQVADGLIALFEAGAGDGFNIIPPYMPGGLDDFVEYVCPILRQRGYLPQDYAGPTLRENLGLAIPTSRYRHV